MEVKEGIEYLRLCKLEDGISQGSNYDEVISLLQDLEKYKEMWKNLENLFKCDKSDFIRDQMMFIKQKYFPILPIKKVITIEVETKNEIAFKMFSEELNKMTNEYFSNVKVNIKEVK